MHFFTCFSLGDLTFSTTAQKRVELGESNADNGLIIYDKLPFIRYNIGNCGVSSFPEHCAESMTTLANASQNPLD